MTKSSALISCTQIRRFSLVVMRWSRST